MSYEAVLTVESFANVRGGAARGGGVLANLDLTAHLDTGAAGWWDGGGAFVYLLANAGGGTLPSAVVGDVQATSNIEAPETWKVYEAWYEQRFAAGRARLLAGLHDYNGDFDALDTAGLFRNSSFGIGPDVSQSGPSIFPATALALRLALDGGGGAAGGAGYLRAAVYDGIPGDPDDPRGTQVILGDDDGLFWAAEVGRQGGASKLGLGAWHHTAAFEDPAGERWDRNGGVYALAEAALAETAAGGRVSGFARAGAARSDRNPVEVYVGAGVVWAAPHPAGPADSLGFAVAHARASDVARRAASERHGQRLAAAETAVELTYAAELRPWLVLQPDLQYIHRPSAEPGLPDAVQIGLTLFLSR